MSLDRDEFRSGSDANGYSHTGERETGIACATWKSYWEEERKGSYDCHKTALLSSLIFLLSSNTVTLASVLVFRKRSGGFEAVPLQLRRGRRALWLGLALHLA